MCSGRVDLRFVLRAFLDGHDGVFIGGCRLNECNYVTHGNYDALAVVHVARFLLEHMGLNPERLNITFMSGGDGNILAEAIDGFTKKVRGLGPLGTAEGMDRATLKTRLEAAERIVPYLRLVERERLRAPSKTKEEFERFYKSDEIVRLFKEIIAEKWELSRIMLLLGQGPLSTGEISSKLSLSPSDVSKHMNSSSRHGLIKYDVARKCYSLA